MSIEVEVRPDVGAPPSVVGKLFFTRRGAEKPYA